MAGHLANQMDALLSNLARCKTVVISCLGIILALGLVSVGYEMIRMKSGFCF